MSRIIRRTSARPLRSHNDLHALAAGIGRALRVPARAASPRESRPVVLLAATLLLAGPLPAWAQSSGWTGAASSDWFDAANWSGGVPAPTDNVNVDTVTPNPAVISGGEAFANWLVLGQHGQGDLTITNGGTLTSVQSRIGNDAGRQGVIRVTGAGSTWNAGFDLLIGNDGMGTLAIADGGTVNSFGRSRVAFSALARGDVTVTGAGSTWNHDGNLVIASSGDGSLAVEAGGSLEVGERLVVANGAGSMGTVSASGNGSRVEVTGPLTVGIGGTGTLTVGDGASLGVRQVELGGATSGDGTLALATGATATSGTIGVGTLGTGTLRIESGASLVSSSAGAESWIGAAAGGTATVTGAGSQWTLDHALIVGRAGTGTLAVSDGARVAGALGIVADMTAGQGTATITGAGSRWDNSGMLYVGNRGEGAMTIADGGSVTATIGSLGGGEDAVGTVEVTGAGSNWTLGDALNIGDSGTAELAIADGGVVTADTVLLGLSAGGTGTATVSGAGSRLQADIGLAVGNGGSGSLAIGDGGVVESGESRLGTAAGGQGEVTVDGAGSAWSVDGHLVVGDLGGGNLDVTGGGAVAASGQGMLGHTAGSTGSVGVIGAGSTLVFGDALQVGREGTGELVIADGGAASLAPSSPAAAYLSIAAREGSAGTMRVTGAGSSWTGRDGIIVGEAGTGTLAVEDGAVVSDGAAILGYLGTGDGAAVVSGSGSRWSSSGLMWIGDAGHGQLSVEDGGVVTSADGVVGHRNGGEGTVTVTGADSAWHVDTSLVVGQGGSGTLSILDGGAVDSADATLGLEAGGVGSARVGGAGSGWTIDGDLRIGSGGDGRLGLTDGGVASVAGTAYLAELAGSTGVLDIGAAAGDAATTAGTLDVAALQFGAGSGTLSFNHTDDGYVFDVAIGGDGSIEQLAGTTILTGASDAGGSTRVRGGTLLVEGSLGDMATTVSSGATLGGSGSIGGDVTVEDGGILAPGSSAGTLTLGALSLSEGAILDYELGQAGVVGGGVNDLIDIDGDLVLDGTLDVIDIGGFGAGVYRLMDYGGTLTDNGLELGTVPTGSDAHDLFVQTAIDGQVNLVNSAGLVLSFWDGAAGSKHNNDAIDGGAGTWNAGNDNWTADDGALNGRWDAGTFAVFGGDGGSVEVVGEQAVAGLQFMSGYTLAAGTDGALSIDGAESVFRVDPGVTATIEAPITGAGGLVKTDTGTLVLSGDNTYAGGTRIDRGTLQVASDANLGDAGGDLAFDGGTLRSSAAFDSARGVTLLSGGGSFETGADLTLSGDITGDGALSKSGEGTLTLSGSNSYAGGTTVLAGTLVGDVDAIRGNLANDGLVVFDQATDASFDGDIAGSGSLAKRGAGVLTLSGDSALDWSIDAGTLVARASTFAGDAAIADGAVFRFDDASGRYDGLLSGAGRFEIDGGDAPFVLGGNSIGFGGATFLDSGTLRVDGGLGGLTTIANGAILTGTGVLGSVDNAGTIAPGNSIGTLTLTGDYIHRGDATLLAEIEPGGDSDLLDITGSATLEGGTVQVIKLPGQYEGGTRYTLVDAAGGVSGTFATLDQDLPFLDLLLDYDADHVYLDVQRNEVGFDIVCGDGTFNQCQVAGALDRIGEGEAITPDLVDVLTEVTSLTLDQARAGFDRLSGEAHASMAGAMLEGHALFGRSVDRRLAERREAIGADRLQGGTWARGYGLGSELDGDGNAHGANLELYGLAVGVDAWATESWLVGMSLNTLKLDADFRPGDGGEADAKNVALYTSVQGERAYLDATASFAWWDSEITRRIELGTLSRRADSEYGMDRIALALEAGLNYRLGTSTLQPLLSVEFGKLSTEGFREHGADDVDLVGRSQDVARTVVGAGLRWTGEYDAGAWTLAPTAQARWLHAFGDRAAEFDLAFAGAPEIGYRVRGVETPEDRGLVGIGLRASRDAVDVFADFDYQAGGGFRAASFGMGVRWRW